MLYSWLRFVSYFSFLFSRHQNVNGEQVILDGEYTCTGNVCGAQCGIPDSKLDSYVLNCGDADVCSFQCDGMNDCLAEVIINMQNSVHFQAIVNVSDGKDYCFGDGLTVNGGTGIDLHFNVTDVAGAGGIRIGTVNAQNSANLYVNSFLGDGVNGVTFELPNSGNAEFFAGVATALRSMVVNAGTHTQNILIDCTSPDGGWSQCSSINVTAASAQFLKIVVGPYSSLANGAAITCPVGSSYDGTEIAPCIIEATSSYSYLNAISITAAQGIPIDLSIELYPSPFYPIVTGLTLTCDAGQDTSVFNVHNTSLTCVTTPSPTLDPPSVATSSTLQPTVSPTKQPTVSPTRSPTRSPTNNPTTRLPTNAPTVLPTTSPTWSPTSFPSDVRMSTGLPTNPPTVPPLTTTIALDDQDEDANSQDSNADSSRTQYVIGGSGGALILTCVFCLVIVFCFYRKSKKKEKHEDMMQDETASNEDVVTIRIEKKPPVSKNPIASSVELQSTEAAVLVVHSLPQNGNDNNGDEKADDANMMHVEQPGLRLSVQSNMSAASSVQIEGKEKRNEQRLIDEEEEEESESEMEMMYDDNIKIEAEATTTAGPATGATVGQLQHENVEHIANWLEHTVNIPSDCVSKYAECFVSNGYETLEKMQDIDSALMQLQLDEIGISSVEHQIMLMGQIWQLKQLSPVHNERQSDAEDGNAPMPDNDVAYGNILEASPQSPT